MTKQHKHYEPAFKLEVARMVVDQGLSIGTGKSLSFVRLEIQPGLP